MLAKLVALVIVSLIIFGPAVFLLRTAWFRGGWPRKLAILFMTLACILITWLFAPTEPGQTSEDHIAQFVGAWGILAACGGAVAIIASLKRKRGKL